MIAAGAPAAITAAVPASNFGVNATVGNVNAGVHRLVVEFVASDHFPFNPDVRQTVTFDVTS